MVSRKKPNWVELVDGPCAGKRAIARPDERGCFEVEKYEGSGLSAVRTLHVYRMETDVWIGRKLRRTARWARGQTQP